MVQMLPLGLVSSALLELKKINLLKHASYFVKKNLSDSNICSCLNHADIYGQFNNGRSGNWLRESKFCAPQQLTHSADIVNKQTADSCDGSGELLYHLLQGIRLNL